MRFFTALASCSRPRRRPCARSWYGLATPSRPRSTGDNCGCCLSSIDGKEGPDDASPSELLAGLFCGAARRQARLRWGSAKAGCGASSTSSSSCRRTIRSTTTSGCCPTARTALIAGPLRAGRTIVASTASAAARRRAAGSPARTRTLTTTGAGSRHSIRATIAPAPTSRTAGPAAIRSELLEPALTRLASPNDDSCSSTMGTRASARREDAAGHQGREPYRRRYDGVLRSSRSRSSKRNTRSRSEVCIGNREID